MLLKTGSKLPMLSFLQAVCVAPEARTEEGGDEGLADNINWGHIVDIEVGAFSDGALHHGQRHAHESAGDGQLLLLCELHHEVLQF